ncbi:hypothetical protein HanIR_Chr16g0789351 [Helianthus annuus]|nr:hypothetical protein HanIR_Chr16g0789351 [Helianthus annuus]
MKMKAKECHSFSFFLKGRFIPINDCLPQTHCFQMSFSIKSPRGVVVSRDFKCSEFKV